MIPLIGVLASVLPSLISAVAGDKAGNVAGKVAEVARAVLGTDDAVEAEKAISGLPPDKMVELRLGLARIAADAETSRQAADLETLRAQLADVAGARAQTVDLVKAGSPIAWGAPVVSVIVTGAFGLVCWMVFNEVIPQQNREMALYVVGQLSGFAGIAVTYWLGSSKSSEAKTELLAKAGPVK